MEAVQLAAMAWLGLQALFGLVAGAMWVAKQEAPSPSSNVCYQELAPDGPAVCPRDFTRFTLPEPGEERMVRR